MDELFYPVEGAGAAVWLVPRERASACRRLVGPVEVGLAKSWPADGPERCQVVGSPQVRAVNPMDGPWQAESNGARVRIGHQ